MATATVVSCDAVDTAGIKAALETLEPAATDKFGFHVVGSRFVAYKVTTS